MSEDAQTEIDTIRRLRRLARRADWRERYYSKNGAVVKYSPTPTGYVVTSQKEVLAEIYLEH